MHRPATISSTDRSFRPPPHPRLPHLVCFALCRVSTLSPLPLRRNQTCTAIGQATWNSYTQSVWTAATAQGLGPTFCSATVFASPNMLGSCWAGLAVISCYGDDTCWMRVRMIHC